MRVAKSGDVYLMMLEPDDDIIMTIQKWCQGQNILNAIISGIGSVQDPTLAHYRRDAKKFTQKKLPGVYEITALNGNIGQVDGGQPLVHLHATLASEHMSAFGGHLVDGVCSATAEIVIKPLTTTFRKNFDESVGLKTWDFDA